MTQLELIQVPPGPPGTGSETNHSTSSGTTTPGPDTQNQSYNSKTPTPTGSSGTSQIPSLSPKHQQSIKSFCIVPLLADADGTAGAEFQIDIDFELVSSWSQVLSLLTPPACPHQPISQVWNQASGQVVSSISQLLSLHREGQAQGHGGSISPVTLVVGGPGTGMSTKTVQLRNKARPTTGSPNPSNGLPTPTTPSPRSYLTKSVFLSGITDSVGDTGPRSHSPGGSGGLLKTFSEQNVYVTATATSSPRGPGSGGTRILDDSNLSLSEYTSSPSTPLQRRPKNHRPRPASCYSGSSPLSKSVGGGGGSTDDSRLSMISRIPVRIQGGPGTPKTNNSSQNNTPGTGTPTATAGDQQQVQINNKRNLAGHGTTTTTTPKIPTTPIRGGGGGGGGITTTSNNGDRDFIRPRLVTIVRSGIMKPRKTCRYLLNSRSARSFDQILSDLTLKIQPDWGAIRRVYQIGSGHEVTSLEDWFGPHRLFLVCPNDKRFIGPEDFLLDSDEVKAIQPYSKVPENCMSKSALSKFQSGLNNSSPARKPIIKNFASAGTKNSNQGSDSKPQVRSAPPTYPTHPKFISVSKYPSFILSKFIVGDLIGDGNFACVRKCIDRISGVKYALKVIDKTKSGKDALPDHEVKILQAIQHPNIILLFDQYEFKTEMYMVMEFVPGGDLFDTIAQYTKFNEDESACMIRDVSLALSFLHEKQIVHRDIKPENLLVYFKSNGQRRIKLGDFGLAQIIQDGSGPLYTICGTPTYVAPEILSETGYGLKVDIWALGIILYILLCGYPPFVSPTGEQEDLFDLILIGDYEFPPEQWDGISEDGKDLIMRMIESDVDLRLDADEVLDHPWLATDPEDCEIKRNRFFRKDFKSNVFSQMGLIGNPFVGKFGPSNSS